MEIKILGKGCPKCHHLEELTEEALYDLGIDTQIIKVKDIKKIMTYDILSTPALVIDKEVKCSGNLPSVDEIKVWIQEAGNE